MYEPVDKHIVISLIFLSLKDFKATFYLSSQLIIFVNDE